MKGFERYAKYHIHKLDDENYLNIKEQTILRILLYAMLERRLDDGKSDNSYVVVNEDEPYAETVWGLIQKHFEAKI